MRISRQAIESIACHAKQSRPHESCGILLCSDDGPSIVDIVIPAENIEKENPERNYILGHKAHLKAVDIEALGEASIAGYYHSHPDGKARPSGRDLDRAISDVIYLITAIGDGWVEHSAWRLDGDGFISEPLEVSE